MKKYVLLLLIASLAFSVKSQTVNERLTTIKEKHPKVFLNIIMYSVERCDKNDEECINKRAKLALDAFNILTNISSEKDYNELALALSIYRNTQKKYIGETVGNIQYINYVKAVGDYYYKYKNLSKDELLRIAPDVFTSE